MKSFAAGRTAMIMSRRAVAQQVTESRSHTDGTVPLFGHKWFKDVWIDERARNSRVFRRPSNHGFSEFWPVLKGFLLRAWITSFEAGNGSRATRFGLIRRRCIHNHATCFGPP